jgi:WD40 repeat protein
MLKLPKSTVLESVNEYLVEPEPPDELVAPFEELRAKARRSPDPAEAVFWVGRFMMRRGQWENAEEAFREAIRLRPGFPQAHLLLGRMSREASPAEAIAEYQAAIRADPDFLPAYSELVDLLRVTGRLEDWVAWKRREYDRRAAAASASPSAAEILTLKGHEKVESEASYSPDGQRILTASADGTARIWDAATGARVLTIKGTGAPLFGASYSPDGARILTHGLDSSARVWDAHSGAEVLTLAGPASTLIKSACYSRDGSRILTASLRTSATVWDAKSGAAILAIERGSDGLLSASFSLDGRRIATQNDRNDRNEVRILDARSGAQLLVMSETRGLYAATFSPDGTRIVLATEDGTASVRDVASGAVVLEFRGHEGKALAAAAYSPDGTRIVTAGVDGTAQVWDARSGAHHRTLIGHTYAPVVASYSPDGTRIVTGSLDGTAKIWVAPP